MKENWDIMKRQNLQIIHIDDGKESQVNGIDQLLKDRRSVTDNTDTRNTQDI